MRRLWGALLLLALLALVCLGTTEGLRNRSGKTAAGVTITFSEKVRISSYDTSIFSRQDPTGRAQTFTFSGGQLLNGNSFRINWTPSSATIGSYEWVTEPDLSGPLEATVETNEYALSHDSEPVASLQGMVTRTIERGTLPFRVTYEAALGSAPAGAILAWDTDIYVDTDGDGNAENDADATGPSLDLAYTENYNPTVKLVVKAASGAEVGTWKNMVRNDFTAGVRIVLDGEALLALTGSRPGSAQWRQQHMEQNSFEYMTEYVADPQDAASLLTQCAPLYAGKYVYELGAGDAAPQLAAWVVETPPSEKRLGLMMADVWNDGWDATGNRIEGGGGFFTDDEARQTLQYLAGEGFDSITVCAPLVLTQVLPTPILSSEAPNSASREDLRWVLPLIRNPHLTTGSYVSGLADPEDQSAWVDFDSLGRSYYESYFIQYRTGVLELAALAREFGTSSMTIAGNHPYLWGLGGVRETSTATSKWVVQQWADMVDATREVLSGEIGISMPGPGEEAARPLRGVMDFIDYTMGGYCPWGDCSQQKRIAATRTAEELRGALESFYRAAAEPTSTEYGAPLLFPVAAASFLGAAREYSVPGHEQASYDAWQSEFARGGYGDEILNGDTMAPVEPSFRDQSLLLETFVPVLVSMPSVGSIWFWGQYWKLMDFSDFTPLNALELHQANNVSLQGKPGLQVVKLWASILEPNERNLYRRVRPLPATIVSHTPYITGYPGPGHRGVSLTAERVSSESSSSPEFLIAYTPKLADDFAAVYQGVIFGGLPEAGRGGEKALALDYAIDNPSIGLWLNIWDIAGDLGNAFAYDVIGHQTLVADGQWHRLIAPLADFEGRPGQQLDLAHLAGLVVALAGMDQVGRTTTLRVKGIEFLSEVPAASSSEISVTWTPSDATVENYEWLTAAQLSGPLEPTIESTGFALAEGSATTGGLRGKVVRTIERGILPFEVMYSVTAEGAPAGATLTWDTDIYVDTDGDGNTENDADATGAALTLVYTENYNPTVKLVVRDASGADVGTWKNMVRNDFVSGETVVLDGEALLASQGMMSPDGASFAWQQLHMEQNSFEYMTEFQASLANQDGPRAWISAKYGGRYALSLTVSTSDGTRSPITAAMWVVESVEQPKEVGITMADVWATGLDAFGNRLPTNQGFFTDQDVVEKLRFLREEGFDLLGVASGAPLVKTWPLPVLVHDEPNLPSDAQLRWLADQIGRMALTVGTYVSGQATSDVDPNAWVDFDRLTRNYFESYFSQFAPRVMELARLAEEEQLESITVGSNHPYLAWGLGEIERRNHATAVWVEQQWASLVMQVKEVFHGQVGIGYMQTATPVAIPLVGVPDFIDAVFGGYGTTRFAQEALAAKTAEELCAVFRSAYMEWYEPLSRDYLTPIRFPVPAISCEGSARLFELPGAEQGTYAKWRPEYRGGNYGDEIITGDILAPFRPSFRDQVLVLEAMFHVLAHLDSVSSIVIWGEYWKLMDFVDFAPQNDLELHQANNSTLQGKPGFAAAKLWASILSPNERNAYRLVRNPLRARAAGSLLGSPAAATETSPDGAPRANPLQGLYVAALPDPESPGATMTAQQLSGEGGTSLALALSYTPRVPDDWGALFLGLTIRGFPRSGLDSCTALTLQYAVDNAEIGIFLTLFDLDGEAFTYDVSRHQQLTADGKWHALIAPLAEFEFGGFGSPDSGNGRLDLDGINALSVAIAGTNQVGRTTTLRVKGLGFLAELPATAPVEVGSAPSQPIPPIALPGTALGEVLGALGIGDLPLFLQWEDPNSLSYSTFDLTTSSSASATYMDKLDRKLPEERWLDLERSWSQEADRLRGQTELLTGLRLTPTGRPAGNS